MEKTDLVIEPITDCEMYNEIIAEAGGWEAFCKEREVKIVPEDDEQDWLVDFTKDGVPYRLKDTEIYTQFQIDHDWYHKNIFV